MKNQDIIYLYFKLYQRNQKDLINNIFPSCNLCGLTFEIQDIFASDDFIIDTENIEFLTTDTVRVSIFGSLPRCDEKFLSEVDAHLQSETIYYDILSSEQGCNENNCACIDITNTGKEQKIWAVNADFTLIYPNSKL